MLGGIDLIHRIEFHGVVDQYLVVGHTVGGEIIGLHIALEALYQGGNGGILFGCFINGDQLIIGKGSGIGAEGHGHDTQIFSVFSRRDDGGIVDHDGFMQGRVGMTGNNEVNALDGLGQLIVLALAVLGAAVGKADHNRLRLVGRLAFGYRFVHHPLGSLGGVLQLHAGVGGAIVGVQPENAEEDVVYAAPLQQDVVLHAIVLQRGLHGGIARGREVVGIHNGRNCLTAIRGDLQHRSEPLGKVIEFMVTEGGGIVAHSAHHPQLDGGGGKGGLKERAHGEIAAVHQNGIGVEGFLLLDGRHQTGIATVFTAILRSGGQQVGMKIMGKKHRDLPLLGGNSDAEAAKQQESKKQSG